MFVLSLLDQFSKFTQETYILLLYGTGMEGRGDFSGEMTLCANISHLRLICAIIQENVFCLIPVLFLSNGQTIMWLISFD